MLNDQQCKDLFRLLSHPQEDQNNLDLPTLRGAALKALAAYKKPRVFMDSRADTLLRALHDVMIRDDSFRAFVEADVQLGLISESQKADEFLARMDVALAEVDGDDPLAHFKSDARNAWEAYRAQAHQEDPEATKFAIAKRELTEKMNQLAAADSTRCGPYLDLATTIRSELSASRWR